jgi:medium-chain acyl-[acyl-carrier-protein] hydrolase
MRMLIPILRADFALSETHNCTADPRIDAPIAVIAGRSDPAVSDTGLAAWRELTSAECTFHRVDGDHFYLVSDPASAASLVARLAMQQMR